jgi:hypothetical protein
VFCNRHCTFLAPQSSGVGAATEMASRLPL